jgi:predicted MFS family arabinose efflux permease
MQDPKRERQILIVLTMMGFTNVLDFMIMMPLAPHLIKAFAISPSQFGSLVSAYALAAGCASLLMASLADRFDRKHALLLVYAGLIVATYACAIAPNFVALLLARTVAGAFGGVQGSVALAIIGDLVPDMRRGRAMGLFMLSFSLASVIGVPLSIYVAGLNGWHAPFFALSALSAVLFAVALRLIPSMRAHISAGESTGFVQGYVELFREPNHWWAFATSALLTLSGMLMIPYVAVSRVANEGMTEAQLSYFYLVGGAVTLVTRPVFGNMSDRYSRSKLYYWLVLASIAPIILITQTLQVSMSLQLLASALFFIFVSGRFVPATALITSAALPQLRGRLMSFNSAVQNFGTGLAAMMGGLMLTQSVDGRMLGYEAVGFLAGIFGIASVFTAFKVRAIS